MSAPRLLKRSCTASGWRIRSGSIWTCISRLPKSSSATSRTTNLVQLSSNASALLSKELLREGCDKEVALNSFTGSPPGLHGSMRDYNKEYRRHEVVLKYLL